MNLVFIFSIILKGIGSVLEILLQVFITDNLGVGGYGTYSAWINAADLLFWIFFSGLIKCNTFYLSGKDTSIQNFRKRYYSRYVMPVFVIMSLAVTIYTKTVFYCVVLLITGLELLTLDCSSTLIARGQAVTSLIGEYVLGRLFLISGVLILGYKKQLSLRMLLALYVIQYILILLYFSLRKKKAVCIYKDVSGEVSGKKWRAYQKADLMHSMIEQMPVVLQYFFSGAFEAGVVSIVLLVKKLINFISGPTAKVFLPEFSRLYHAGERQKICSCYASIMRIQMLIVGPLAVVLLGYPKVVLRILAAELAEYSSLFIICSTIFLLSATLGPCGGILQMTGNEKTDIYCREAALIGMVVIMLLARKDSYFVLYGLCGQIMFEATAKYIFICRWMKKAPVDIYTYIKWWILPCIAIIMTHLLRLQESFVGMCFMAGIVFAVKLGTELRNDENSIMDRLRMIWRR